MVKPTFEDGFLETASPRTIAEQVLDANNGKVLDATKEFLEIVQGNDNLYRRVTAPFVENACYQLIGSVVRTRRKVMWHPHQPTHETVRNNMRAVAKSLLDFQLPGGKTLRNALKPEILEAASFYQKQSSDMNDKAKWLVAIAEQIPNDKTKASKVWTARRLLTLKNKIETQNKPKTNGGAQPHAPL